MIMHIIIVKISLINMHITLIEQTLHSESYYVLLEENTSNCNKIYYIIKDTKIKQMH